MTSGGGAGSGNGNWIEWRSYVSRWELVAALAILGGLLVGLGYLLPFRLYIIVLSVGSMTAVFYVSSVVIVYYDDVFPEWGETVPVWTTLLLPFTVAAVVLTQLEARIPPLTLVLVFALVFVFFYYWLVVPLALYQRLQEQYRSPDVEEWPSISVLVPAYNEEGYVGPAIESFLAADYPSAKLEVVVVDDGSTDGTYEEAQEYASSTVSVYQKSNGGKHSALNYGLEQATGEYVVTVDADSILRQDAFKELVRAKAANPDAGAIAGNVKVANQGTLVTNVQALEYVIGINTFRRAFDLIGVVTVVPGCLGLFERDVIEEVGRYSADTITEDFDLTIQLLKQGVSVHHGNAVVHTEVPDTWHDLYRQRLRWFRGNIQTVLKHRGVASNPEFGVLHRVGFPYLVFSMSVLPALGIVIFGVLTWRFIQGSITQFLGILAMFVCLQVLLSLLAIHIEDENPWLARYAPLSIVGYKQFLDAVLLKSLVDVLRKDDLAWTSPTRIRQRDDPTRAESRQDD